MSTESTLSLLRTLETDLEEALSRVRRALESWPGSGPGPSPVLGTPEAPQPALIVVDPGHGGDDPGAHVPNPEGAGEVEEKALVVPYAMAIRDALLEAQYTTKLTRTGDTFVGLSERAEIANQSHALCFISVHANAASAEARNGAWILYDDKTKPKDGRALAESVFHSLSLIPGLTDSSPQAEVFPDGSPWVAGRQLTVLSKTRMPAILIELGFLTNEDDLGQLLNPDTRVAVARAVAVGVCEWHKERIAI